MDIKKGLGEMTKALGTTATNTFSMFRAYKKIEKINYARVIYADKNGILHGLDKDDELYADVNIEHSIARLKGMSRLFFVEYVHRTKSGQAWIILSDGRSDTLDLTKYRNYFKLYDTAEKNKDFKTLKALEIEIAGDQEALNKLNVSKLDVALNLNAFDNERDRYHSDKAEKIMANNMFRLLDDVPSRTVIMLLIIGFLIGGLFAMIMSFLIMIGMEVLKTMG